MKCITKRLSSRISRPSYTYYPTRKKLILHYSNKTDCILKPVSNGILRCKFFHESNEIPTERIYKHFGNDITVVRLKQNEKIEKINCEKSYIKHRYCEDCRSGQIHVPLNEYTIRCTRCHSKTHYNHKYTEHFHPTLTCNHLPPSR